MVCEHLIEVEQAVRNAGFRETFRGRAWSQNCREWVYFDCFLPLETIRQTFNLASCVQNHEHLGTHDGQESGFICTSHHDGIMGHHPLSGVSAQTFSPENS